MTRTCYFTIRTKRVAFAALATDALVNKDYVSEMFNVKANESPLVALVRDRYTARAGSKRTGGLRFTKPVRLMRNRSNRRVESQPIKISIKTNTYSVFHDAPIPLSATKNGGSKWAW